MTKQLLYLVISLLLNLNSFAITNSERSFADSINDGPYIFNVNNEFKIKWIENSILKEGNLTSRNFSEIKNKFNLLFNYNYLTNIYSSESNYEQSYEGIDSISVITDIHGEYKSYIDLMKATGIIDKNLNWSFGKGHLVVLGDIFDRGNMVTEILWHLFGLEKQAAEAGGMVHVLLGNHEVLVFNKELSYINEKYRKVEEISNIKYFDLFSENSVLGKWLRSKPVVITIDNIIFVHGGISIGIIQRNLSIKQINQIFTDKIFGKNIEINVENEELQFLDENNGPLWYRGYFTDTNLHESRIDSILEFYGKAHLVVGHTTYKEIKTLFSNKIIGVDAGIMIDQPGEMLIYKNGLFYKGYITGIRIKL